MSLPMKESCPSAPRLIVKKWHDHHLVHLCLSPCFFHSSHTSLVFRVSSERRGGSGGEVGGVCSVFVISLHFLMCSGAVCSHFFTIEVLPVILFCLSHSLYSYNSWWWVWWYVKTRVLSYRFDQCEMLCVVRTTLSLGVTS